MNAELEKKLEAEIKRHADARNETPFEMKTVTDFEWDRLYVFTPYTPFSSISEKIGPDADKLKEINMDMQEEINLLVFVKGKDVVSYLEFPRRKGDFDKINRPDGFTPENARFTVTVEDRGEPWITVLEAK